jgi:hypothetical protein
VALSTVDIVSPSSPGLLVVPAHVLTG